MSTHKVDETIGSVLSFLALNATTRTKVTGIIRARLSRGSDVTKAARIRSAIKRLTDAFKWNGIEEDDYRQQLRELQAELALCERVPDERRMLEAMRIAQDIPRAWKLASAEQRRRMTWSVFEQITISGGVVVSAEPQPDLKPLFAAAVHSSGPDRGPSRTIERSAGSRLRASRS